MNPFKILGVSESASDEEVKRAYRSQAAKHHPDMGGDGWAFEQVRQAYESIMRGRNAISPSSPQTSPNTNSTREASKPHPKSNPNPKSASTPNPNSTPNSNPNTKASPNSQTAPAPDPSLHSHPHPKNFLELLRAKNLPLQSETNYFILVNVLDIVMTNILLRMNAMESNPFAKWVLDRWGFVGMIAFKLIIVAVVCIIAQFVATRNLPRAKQLLYLGTAIVGAVVLYSALLLARTKGYY